MLQRDQRLKMEAERMAHVSSLSPFIEYRAISRIPDLPPDRYEVSFFCKGLIRHGDFLKIVEEHKVMLYLHPKYPTQQPRMAWLTPIFHPNIKGRTICLGRSWTPAMTLDELCVILGEMVQYKLFNLNDPLDTECAIIISNIMESDPDFIPVDNRNLLNPEIDFDLEFSNFGPDELLIN